MFTSYSRRMPAENLDDYRRQASSSAETRDNASPGCPTTRRYPHLESFSRDPWTRRATTTYNLGRRSVSLSTWRRSSWFPRYSRDDARASLTRTARGNAEDAVTCGACIHTTRPRSQTHLRLGSVRILKLLYIRQQRTHYARTALCHCWSSCPWSAMVRTQNVANNLFRTHVDTLHTYERIVTPIFLCV